MKKELHRILEILCLTLLVTAGGMSALSVKDIRVFDAPVDTMMSCYLKSKVEDQFAKRDMLLAGMTTREKWINHADSIRAKFKGWTGPFPERNELNAKIAGVVERNGYRVEKVYFQSRPGFYVSADVYIPSSKKEPFPAVLYAVGHSIAGKAVGYAQTYCIGQVRKGILVMAFDGLGQGERRQKEYFVFGKSPGSVHQTIGFQAFLAGTHVFNLMIWDAIRAVDYLESRTDVDPDRIGITGTSGGGMISTYILPFDERIAAAVPACNPNTWLSRVNADLSTDHEQVFFGAFKELIDPRGDPLLCLAPKPLLINATAYDNLNPPEGVWALDKHLYRAWAAFGAPEKMHTSMVNATHDYNRDQREVAYAWFSRWLGNGPPESLDEGTINVETEKDLFSTKTGNVYDLPGSLEPHALVLDYFKRHRFQADNSLKADQLRKNVIEKIRKVTAISNNPDNPNSMKMDTRIVDKLELTTFVIQPEDKIVIPAILIKSPAEKVENVVLYLNDKGKEALVSDSEMLSKIYVENTCILAVDLRGQGETAPALEDKFWDFLAGDPPSSQKIRDILSVLAWTRSEFPNCKIHIEASGVSGLWAAIAAVLDGGVSSLYLEHVPVDFADMVETKLPVYNHEIILPGILTQLDMQEVYKALCSVKVTLISPVRANGNSANIEYLRDRYRDVKEYFKNNDMTANWNVKTE